MRYIRSDQVDLCARARGVMFLFLLRSVSVFIDIHRAHSSEWTARKDADE